MEHGQRVDVYIAVGSNLGDRRGQIESGIAELGVLERTEMIQVSSLIETEPVGPGDQGVYLNGALHIQTGLGPEELLAQLLKIESNHGRDRSREQRWGARTLDLDILIFGDQQIHKPGLIIPHERMHERSFVLIPLCEIASEIQVPGRKETPREMLGALVDAD